MSIHTDRIFINIYRSHQPSERSQAPSASPAMESIGPPPTVCRGVCLLSDVLNMESDRGTKQLSAAAAAHVKGHPRQLLWSSCHARRAPALRAQGECYAIVGR